MIIHRPLARSASALASLLCVALLCVAFFTHAQIAAAALEAHWPFDDGFGTAAADVTGNGNDGTLINGPTWTSGQLGSNALSFDGSNQYVNTGTMDVAGSAISISAYLWSNDLANCGSGGDCRILAKSSGTGGSDQYFMLSTINSGGEYRLRFRLKTGGSTTALIGTAGSLEENAWYHVVGVYDGSEMRLYQNGVEVGSTGKTGSIDTNPGLELWIGGSPTSGTSKPWDGKIDDVRIYSQALTVPEILALAADQEALCNNLLDDDSDGLIDCLDADCAGELVCQSESRCFDAYDNDLDANIDCADLDCDGSQAPAVFTVGFEDIPGLIPDNDIDAADFDSMGVHFDISDDHSNFVLGEVFFLGEPLPYNDGGAWFAVHGTYNSNPHPENPGNVIGWEYPTTLMTLPSATPFDLVRLDLTETLIGASATSVHLTGTTSLGSSVVLEVMLDDIHDGTGPLEDWQTVVLDPAWTDLVSVSFVPEGEAEAEWAIDNVVISRIGTPPFCEATLELACLDGFDNDGDGLSDCDDLDCTAASACLGPESVPAISLWGIALLGTLLTATTIEWARRAAR